MQQALLEAYNIHRDALLGYIRKRVVPPELAEDLLHDIYIKLSELPSETAVAYPKAYLYRMANNLTIDMTRAQQRIVNANDNEYFDEESPATDPEQSEAYRQKLDIVAKALDELPEKTRDVFRMQRIREVDKSDVAHEMGISVNMVEKHLRKAVQYCREKLNKSDN